MRGRWYVGTPEVVADGLHALGAEHGVDEVMVNPVAGVTAGTSAGAAPTREETLRLLAKTMSS